MSGPPAHSAQFDGAAIRFLHSVERSFSGMGIVATIISQDEVNPGSSITLNKEMISRDALDQINLHASNLARSLGLRGGDDADRGEMWLAEIEGVQVVGFVSRIAQSDLVLVLALLCNVDESCVEEAVLLQRVILDYFDLWQSHRLRAHENDALSSASDALDIGVLLFGRKGEIIGANRAAAAMLDQGDCVRRAAGGVAAAKLQDALALQTAISHVIAANERRGDDAVRSREAPTLVLRSRDERRHLLFWVVPLERSAEEASHCAAVAYLLDPKIDLRRQLEPVCVLHGLSPVETRLVCHLSGGMSLREATDAMRIKEQTGRGYLKQIFLKTGTHRQAELVQTMLTTLMRMPETIDPVVLS